MNRLEAEVAGDSDAKTPIRRRGWLRKLLVVLCAFACGFGYRHLIAEREKRLERLGFLMLLRVTQPVRIDVEWKPYEWPTGTGLAYAGEATIRFTNQVGGPMRIAFPWQTMFAYSATGISGKSTRAFARDFPDWATNPGIIELKDGESREFRSMLHADQSDGYTIGGWEPGYFGFDFAAPPGEDASGYVTGTVFASARADVR